MHTPRFVLQQTIMHTSRVVLQQTTMHTSRVVLQQTIMHTSRFVLEQTVMHTPEKESRGDKTTTYSSCVDRYYQRTGLLRILHSQTQTIISGPARARKSHSAFYQQQSNRSQCREPAQRTPRHPPNTLSSRADCYVVTCAEPVLCCLAGAGARAPPGRLPISTLGRWHSARPYFPGHHERARQRQSINRRRHWEKVKQDPERHEKTKRLNKEAVKRYQARKKMLRQQSHSQ